MLWENTLKYFKKYRYTTQIEIYQVIIIFVGNDRDWTMKELPVLLKMVLTSLSVISCDNIKIAWVYAPCERTRRNGKVHVTFSVHAHGT